MKRIVAALFLCASAASAQQISDLGPQGGFDAHITSICARGSLDPSCLVKTSNGTSLAGDNSVQAPGIGVNALAYQNAAANSGTVSMQSGKSVLTLTGAVLVAALTVKLPPNPMDGQMARISSQVVITLLTVQDANGNAVGPALSLAALSAGGLYQFQSTAWVRIA